MTRPTASGTPGEGLADEALLARVVEHDEAALSELYDRYAPCLLGVAQRILSDRSAAEEVAGAVFLRLWDDAARYTPHQASVAAALLTMVRAAAVNRRRADQRLAPIRRGGPEPLKQSPVWLPRPEEIALLEERWELLRKVLSQLPKAQRGALELAVFGGYTETEISEKLGEPLGRVKSELRAGMRFFRHRLRAVLGTWAANI